MKTVWTDKRRYLPTPYPQKEKKKKRERELLSDAQVTLSKPK